MPELTIDVHLQVDERRRQMVDDVRRGLSAVPKSLPPVWFYDERGSLLFDEITRLPEYYLTRSERSILTGHAKDIAVSAAADTLVELGSGTSEKTRLLLDAMVATGRLRRFIPLDVSEEILLAAAEDIGRTYSIDVHAVVGDFHRHLGELPKDGTRLVAFLGSTIGNFTPDERSTFFADLRANLDGGDHLLLGTDLVKAPERLLAAYDDSRGVTAAFNKNVLDVLNAELGATFDVDQFDHVARWNATERWMEMWLRSRVAQAVDVRAIDLRVHFEAGEEMRTEISAKFTPDQVEAELRAAGFEVTETWTDAAGDFLLTLAAPATS
jgi:L-histidine N-alpha-methyltransferase